MFSKLISIIFVTGFLTACGASGGGQADPDPISNGPSSNATISSTPTSVAASSVTSQTPSSIASSIASQTSSVGQTSSMMSSSRSSVSSSRSSSSRSSSLAVSSSMISSSRSSVSSSRSSSSRSSSLAVSSSSSSSSAASSSSAQPRQATIRWSHPTQRENGDYLELDEIGGYQIRVRLSGTAVYTYYPIAGNQTTSYPLNNYLSTMTVEIAVYDTQGLYSQFVTVSN